MGMAGPAPAPGPIAISRSAPEESNSTLTSPAPQAPGTDPGLGPAASEWPMRRSASARTWLMPGFERIVAGSGPSHEPPFLKRAKTRLAASPAGEA